MKIIKNDEAVSPVIGVILMVAITVILAAVIAAFVFGMAGTSQTTKTVSLTLTLSDDYGKIVINGGTDLPALNEMSVSVDGGAVWETVRKSGASDTEILETQFTVGRIVYTHQEIVGKTVQVKGKFDDGSEQILLTKQF